MGNKRIIIAEDHVPTRRIIVRDLKEALRIEGFFVEFEEVNNGNDLVEKVLKGEFVVALTDCDMPEKNGLRAIRDIREFRDIPLIMISSPEYKKEALKYGATAYVIKLDTNLIHNLVMEIRPYL